MNIDSIIDRLWVNLCRKINAIDGQLIISSIYWSINIDNIIDRLFAALPPEGYWVEINCYSPTVILRAIKYAGLLNSLT